MLVLIVVTMLALGSLGFAELMLNEHRAALTASRQSQARALAEAGREVARQFLDRYPDDIQTAGGLYDNPQRFSSQIVADDASPRDQGRFTILAPKIDDTVIAGVATACKTNRPRSIWPRCSPTINPAVRFQRRQTTVPTTPPPMRS